MTAPGTREITFREAIREAMAEEMRRDESIFLIGEDVGKSGGIFKCSEGLWDEFGSDRVIDAPIAEEGYVGLSVGAAMTGMRPIAELMFGDFALLTMDQLVNQAAKIRYMTGGQCHVSLTVRLSMGAGRSSAAQHGSPTSSTTSASSSRCSTSSNASTWSSACSATCSTAA